MTQSCGFVFVGPSPDVIALMGDKIEARRQAKLAGVPITPGSEGAVNSVSEAQSICERLGFPVMIKAAAGGGGRGMRIASDREQLPGALRTARAEAKSFFADDRVYIETLVQNPRHIEVQLLGDRYGNVVHFGERDCSLQRRNQKLIEEAPSPFADPRLREALGNASVRLAKQVGYEGVGTIEYLVDDKRNFYFMEMNTRIQVEHPVTEETTDFDLIKLQIESAAGAVLDIRQSEIAVKGHSIECRINAEDPGHDFRPTPGRIDFVHFPGGRGVRVDSAIFSGYEVPSDYDNLLAKIIVHGKTRTEATLRMRRALLECQITGPATNIDFLLSVLREEDFVEGRIDIGWLGRNLDRLTESRDLPEREKSSAY